MTDFIDEMMGFNPADMTVFNEPASSNFDANIYKTNPKNSKADDGHYRSKIRIVYNPFDLKRSIVNQATYWLNDTHPDTDVHIHADIMIHNTERNRCRGAVLIADQFLGVKVIDPLIFRRFAAKRNTSAKSRKGAQQAFAEAAGEYGGFSGGVISKLAGFCSKFCNSALIDDHHALAVCHCNHRTAGDNVIRAFCIAGQTGHTFFALNCQNVGRK